MENRARKGPIQPEVEKEKKKEAPSSKRQAWQWLWDVIGYIQVQLTMYLGQDAGYLVG